MADNIYQFTADTVSNPTMILDPSQFTNNWTYLPTNTQPYQTGEQGLQTVDAECTTGSNGLPMNGLPMNSQYYSSRQLTEPQISINARWTGMRDEEMMNMHRRRIAGVKRKGQGEFGRRSKWRRTDEQMAAKMSELFIDLNQCSATNQSAPSDDENMSYDELTSRLSDHIDDVTNYGNGRLELSDVLKETLVKSSGMPLIPAAIAKKISNPCTDLVLWQPLRITEWKEGTGEKNSPDTGQTGTGRLPVWGTPDNDDMHEETTPPREGPLLGDNGPLLEDADDLMDL